jgi:hypothetical protein
MPLAVIGDTSCVTHSEAAVLDGSGWDRPLLLRIGYRRWLGIVLPSGAELAHPHAGRPRRLADLADSS